MGTYSIESSYGLKALSDLGDALWRYSRSKPPADIKISAFLAEVNVFMHMFVYVLATVRYQLYFLTQARLYVGPYTYIDICIHIAHTYICIHISAW
jgi:hypothetical protein